MTPHCQEQLTSMFAYTRLHYLTKNVEKKGIRWRNLIWSVFKFHCGHLSLKCWCMPSAPHCDIVTPYVAVYPEQQQLWWRLVARQRQAINSTNVDLSLNEIPTTLMYFQRYWSLMCIWRKNDHPGANAFRLGVIIAQTLPHLQDGKIACSCKRLNGDLVTDE